MATWIVHLRIAEDLLRRIPGLDAETFAVGSIAPDSGLPDEKWETFTPPSHVTHFGLAEHKGQGLADLEFYRRYLLPLRSPVRGEATNMGLFSFRLGYFFHLVSDNLWNEKIGLPTQERWAEQFAADKDFIWEVKKDWYGLDFVYVREHPHCLYWCVFLEAQPETGGLGFMLEEGIRQRVAYIQEYYQRRDEKVEAMVHRPRIYLTQADMDCFVEQTSQQLDRIYHTLWVEGRATDSLSSALALPF